MLVSSCAGELRYLVRQDIEASRNETTPERVKYHIAEGRKRCAVIDSWRQLAAVSEHIRGAFRRSKQSPTNASDERLCSPCLSLRDLSQMLGFASVEQAGVDRAAAAAGSAAEQATAAAAKHGRGAAPAANSARTGHSHGNCGDPTCSHWCAGNHC